MTLDPFSWIETLILSASPTDVVMAIDVVTAIEPPNELQSDFQVVWPEEPTIGVIRSDINSFQEIIIFAQTKSYCF